MGSQNQELYGLMTALITPLTEDSLHIDADALQVQVERLIKAGVHGLVPGGSTGECMALTVSERKTLIDLTIKFAAGRVPVIPGAGAMTTADAVEIASHAGKAGATAILVVPPFYESPTLEQVHQYLADISKTTGIPLVYYNVPGVSGLSLTPEQLGDLSKHGVKYVKDTSGNGPALTDLLFNQPTVTCFNGWDTLTFYGLAAGSKGAIWGAPNVAPDLCVAFYNAIAVQKDLDLARTLWRKILPICKFLEEEGNYTCSVKTAVQLQGYKTGPLRAPYTHVHGEKKAKLAKILVDAGVKVVQ